MSNSFGLSYVFCKLDSYRNQTELNQKLYILSVVKSIVLLFWLGKFEMKWSQLSLSVSLFYRKNTGFQWRNSVVGKSHAPLFLSFLQFSRVGWLDYIVGLLRMLDTYWLRMLDKWMSKLLNSKYRNKKILASISIKKCPYINIYVYFSTMNPLTFINQWQSNTGRADVEQCSFK
jgi:hypothetical protein